ncbi:MAG TPA: response regulator transcription factor [Flavobacteriaceae bacterium]|nr:response regulator transcription factor [Flavobacteriaceae bacterium]HPF10999.1 response regulator transcription factor [Flavobacteriaceae bacterium]HQU20260.1 response regulator transcription factor [Flavobacteriaceae bacterium]HQU64152.1 response regulator transcription factor [Flavobacteriaceae bacterium]HRW45592.1 response regulator transcription factor [Flavobacteriaceae bacterium]
MKHRIVIVEDHEALLEAMTLMLEASQKFRVEGRYKNAEEAMVHIPQLRPDAVLMDINLPRLSGIECVSQLKSRCPEILFVMCTSFEDDQKIFESLEAGASGYILKTDGPVRIISALEDLFEGGSPMSASIARKVVNSFSKFSKKPNVEMELLTEREREILDLIAKGFLNKEVSEKLFISLGTVKKHVQNIYEKLHVNTRVEAVNKYLNRHA